MDDESCILSIWVVLGVFVSTGINFVRLVESTTVSSGDGMEMSSIFCSSL